MSNPEFNLDNIKKIFGDLFYRREKKKRQVVVHTGEDGYKMFQDALFKDAIRNMSKPGYTAPQITNYNELNDLIIPDMAQSTPNINEVFGNSSSGTATTASTIPNDNYFMWGRHNQNPFGNGIWEQLNNRWTANFSLNDNLSANMENLMFAPNPKDKQAYIEYIIKKVTDKLKKSYDLPRIPKK